MRVMKCGGSLPYRWKTACPCSMVRHGVHPWIGYSVLLTNQNILLQHDLRSVAISAVLPCVLAIMC